MRVARAAALTFAGLVLGACGGYAGPPRVDADQVERLLVQRQKERNPALRVGQASCPTGVEARQGESFECGLDVEGQAARFSVTMVEVLGGERVRYDFRPLQAIVDITGTSNVLRSRLDDEWRSATIDCGPGRARVVSVGTVIECTVSKPPATRRVQAIVEDIDGTVRLEEQ